MDDLEQLRQQMHAVLSDFQEQASLEAGQLFVIGCSTSEVIGSRIGTSGTIEVAQILFEERVTDTASIDLPHQKREWISYF